MTYIKGFIKKADKFIRKNHIMLLSFLLPAVILEIAYITRGIFPFGKLDVLLIDLYHQYAPFLSELQDKFRSFSSLLYSWSGGLGTSFLPQFAYYLSSPLNFLIVLFPKSLLTEAILVLILLKVGLSGLCFNIFLKGVHGRQSIITMAFSILYALSGYVLAYCWNIMWLDAIFLLPLVILGLHRFIRDGRYILYCVSLAVLLLSNFYIAFFVCLFTFLYYPVCLFQYHSIKNCGLLIKKTLKFAFFSLLSAGMSAVLLLPTYFSLKLTSAASDVFPNGIEHYYDIFDYISRHFIAASPTIREGLPNLYCGIIVLIFLPVYFFSRNISLKEKLPHLALVSVLAVSFNVNVLNFIWHGFHFPNQLPFRFSFLYVFLVLTMCYPAYSKLNEFSGKQTGIFCSIVLILIILSQKLDAASPGITTIYVSILFVVIYAAVLTYKRFSPEHKALALLLVIIAEICTSTILTIGTVAMTEWYTLRDGYASGTEVKQIREQLSSVSNEETSFYRTEIYPPRTTNDPYLYNYNGLSIFSSTSPMKPVKMLERLGYHSNGINSYKYEGSTIFLDSFFGIKYLLYRSIDIDEKLYQVFSTTDEVTVFKNSYALPLGFQVPYDIKDWHPGWANPFESQNALMKCISGTKNIFTPLDQKQGFHYNMDINPSSVKYYNYKRPNKDTNSTAKIQILNKTNQQVYLYLDTKPNDISEGFVMIGDKKVNFNASRSTLVNLGFCNADTLIEAELTFKKEAPESGSFQLYSYGLNFPEFEKGISLVNSRSMQIDSFTDNRIKGSINAQMNGVMLITVPYDKGWRVKVDNIEIAAEPVDDGLLSFEVTKGLHNIELWFIPDKFPLGLIISIGSFVIFGLVLLIPKLKKSGKIQS